MPEPLTHRVQPMSGRDPDQDHRAATPLELLFDLAFVVAFGTAANELAHYLAADHVEVGVVGFLFATFAISWAWINFAWFASAYDTDDWIYRLTTMVQMVGVLVLALGLSDMFASLEEGDHVDNAVMVAGYVVMRVAMTFQWLRASRDDPARRGACLTNVGYVLAAQVGWIVLLVAHTSVVVTFLCIVPLVLLELAGPLLAETRYGGIPWHADHIAERYGLLVIIALGEGMIGTMASMSAIVGPHGEGWSVDFVLVGLAGVAITFGMWWVYFVIPHGAILARRRSGPSAGATATSRCSARPSPSAPACTSRRTTSSTTRSWASWAPRSRWRVPLGVYLLMVFVLYAQLTHTLDPFHFLLLALTAVGSSAPPCCWPPRARPWPSA